MPNILIFLGAVSVSDCNCYQLKMDCFKIFQVSPMVTTKKMPKKDTQNKIRKESKHVTANNEAQMKTRGKKHKIATRQGKQ